MATAWHRRSTLCRTNDHTAATWPSVDGETLSHDRRTVLRGANVGEKTFSGFQKASLMRSQFRVTA